MDLKEIKQIIQEVRKEADIFLFRPQALKEGGFSRIRQIMLGTVPTVDTVAILTAENPGGQPATPQENKRLMNSLKSSLQSLQVGYTDIGGSFGSPEKSVFITNISRDDTSTLGEDFGQEAVIWGQKMRGDEDKPFFRFEYIEGHNTIQTRDVSLGGQEIEDRDDFYSEKGGRKFFIPFFDDDYERARPKDSGRRISFEPEELDESAEVLNLVESINDRTKKLMQNSRTAKSKWHHRNMLRFEINSLDKLIKRKI